MKSALILGLALTASAFSADQYDNELIVAPTDQFGNIKNYPRNIRFDDLADDELLVRPGYLQVADDELRIAPLDEFARNKPYPPNVRFDKDGNDLFSFQIPRYRNLTNRFPGAFDDELMRGPYQRRRRSVDIERRKKEIDEADNEYAVRGKASAAKKYRPGLAEHVKKHPETVFFDEGDDELISRPSYLQIADYELIKPPKKNNKGNVVYDDEVDNELHTKVELIMRGIVKRIAESLAGAPSNKKQTGKVMHDDELLVRPVVPYVAADDELSLKSPRLFTERGAEALRRDDEADNELHSNIKMSSKLFVQRQAEARRKDDEGDDELAWLDGLLQEAPYNGAIFRALDDDEFKAEKLGHLKGQKMDRFRDHELPEIRGKVKPLGDGGFLPFN